MLQTLTPSDRLNPEHFCYWLQGLLEDARLKTLDEVQVQMIREHLSLVFHHVALPQMTVTTTPAPAMGPAQTITLPSLDDLLKPRTVMIC